MVIAISGDLKKAMNDRHFLSRFDDSISFLYFEHCKIHQDNHSIVVINEYGETTAVPAATLSVLMVGPGTTISHQAMVNLGDCGVVVLWLGDNGVRFYASGCGKTWSAKNLITQAKLWANEATRRAVAVRMYRMRFSDPVDENVEISQLMLMEARRMKEVYTENAIKYKVKWYGRKYRVKEWERSDPMNRALSTAHSCLYGVCHAAIVAMGYSPGLGFLHLGQQLSLVYDIGDLYKAEFSIPIAFEAVALGTEDLEKRVRYRCRDAFKKQKLLNRIVSDLKTLMDINILNESDRTFVESVKTSTKGETGQLWSEKKLIDGGKDLEKDWTEEMIISQYEAEFHQLGNDGLDEVALDSNVSSSYDDDEREGSTAVPDVSGDSADEREGSTAVPDVSGDSADEHEGSTAVPDVPGGSVDEREGSTAVPDVPGGSADEREGSTAVPDSVSRKNRTLQSYLTKNSSKVNEQKGE